jgi:hypothetical protein
MNNLLLPIDYVLADTIVKASLTEVLDDLKQGKRDTNDELAYALFLVLYYFSDPTEKDTLVKDYGDMFKEVKNG